jgi:hypothetical protein
MGPRNRRGKAKGKAKDINLYDIYVFKQYYI